MADEAAPLQREVTENVPNIAAASDDVVMIGKAPFGGDVAGVTYTPDANVTGNSTETRTLSLVNRGSDGSGTTVVALLALTTGVNLTAGDERALTLSATPANLSVNDDDVLAWSSVHGGATGLADPGGLVTITFDREAGT